MSLSPVASFLLSIPVAFVDPSLADHVDVAGEAEIAQVMEEGGLEERRAADGIELDSPEGRVVNRRGRLREAEPLVAAALFA